MSYFCSKLSLKIPPDFCTISTSSYAYILLTYFKGVCYRASYIMCSRLSRLYDCWQTACMVGTVMTSAIYPVVYWGVYAGIRHIPTSGIFWQRILTSVIINKQGTFRPFATPVCVYPPPVLAIHHWIYPDSRGGQTRDKNFSGFVTFENLFCCHLLVVLCLHVRIVYACLQVDICSYVRVHCISQPTGSLPSPASPGYVRDDVTWAVTVDEVACVMSLCGYLLMTL